MNVRNGWLKLVAGSLAVPSAGAPARAMQDAPACPPIDASAEEELAQPRQADLAKGGALADRHLRLAIRYPAAATGPGTTYRTARPA